MELELGKTDADRREEFDNLLRQLKNAATDFELDPEHKKKWLAALRSGEYGQAQGTLHDREVGWCCLGLYAEKVCGTEWAKPDMDGFIQFGDEEYQTEEGGLVPTKAEVRGPDNEVDIMLNHALIPSGVQAVLARANDHELRFTFAEVADMIEEAL